MTKGLAWTAAAQFANMALKPFPIPDEGDDALSILDTTSGSFTAAGSLMTMKSVEPLHKLLHNWLFSWGTDASLVTTPVPTSLAQDTLPSYLEQEPVPSTQYHLTARPWHPLGSEKYLDVVEEQARFWARQEDPQVPGRVLEPYYVVLGTVPGADLPDAPQVKWGTVPLSIAILVKAGRAADLLNFAVRVMEHETVWFQTHVVQKGEANLGLFVDFQVSAFDLLNSISAVPQSHKDLWRKRLSVPNEKLAPIMSAGGSPNSYYYRLLSEWNRYRLRLAYDQSTIVNVIESLWRNTEKKAHRNLCFIYFPHSNEAKAKGFECIREQWAS